MNRRTELWLADLRELRLGAVGALTLVGVALMTGCTTAPDPSAPTPAPTPVSTAVQTAPPLTDIRAGELSEALVSGDPGRVADAVAMPSGSTIPPEAAAQFQALGTITVVPGSFTPIDAVTGVVEATGAGGRWRLYLVFKDGEWRIVSTEQLS